MFTMEKIAKTAHRVDLMETARKVAHKYNVRCRGGGCIGDDKVRYHTKKCDDLTADIYVQLRAVAKD